jgi:hypothetical protein
MAAAGSGPSRMNVGPPVGAKIRLVVQVGNRVCVCEGLLCSCVDTC